LRGKTRVGLSVLSIIVDVDIASTRRPRIALSGRLCRAVGHVVILRSKGRRLLEGSSDYCRHDQRVRWQSVGWEMLTFWNGAYDQLMLE
jgi:hypothetical protein